MDLLVETREIDGIKFSYTNKEEFSIVYNEIFIHAEYHFMATTDTPLILDCGAHIGLSVLYFKHIYPKARIVAFEPNPDSFKLLERNVKQNNLQDVTIINAAVAPQVGEIDFYVARESFDSEKIETWAWAFSGVKNTWYDPAIHQTIKVPTSVLSTHIDQKIDMLKLDIEGMEGAVLEEIREKLGEIKNISMEFHGSVTNTANNFSQIIALLKKAHFHFLLQQDMHLLQLHQMKTEGDYSLMVYASKQFGTLWWGREIAPPIRRVIRRIKTSGANRF